MTSRLILSLAFAASLLLWAPAPLRAQPIAPASLDEPRQILVFLRLPPEHYRAGAGYGGAYGDGQGRSARMRLASRLAREHGLRVVSQWPMPSLSVDCFVMEVPERQSPTEAASRVAADPQVSWAQPVQLFHGEAAATEAPNDPLYRAQPAATAWGLADLHRIATGRRVRVAVIDSMVDAGHPDLTGQIETAQNFVIGRPSRAEPHGTAVAGVIAARRGNGIGIAGVAPDARLLALRGCWEPPGRSALCDSLSVARALDFAIARRAQVINLSLSGPPDPLIAGLLDLGLTRGAAIVAAYDRSAPGGGFPASHKGVVAVADASGGPAIRGVLAAPGRGVPTTQPGGRWYVVSGSSYAAAHVSGLFALLRERSPVVHSPVIAAVAQSGDGIDACATILQKAAPCDRHGAPPRGIPAVLPK